MPDIIHLLPDAIANQIAAGEVIQRPASAVKELLENAVDAGADEIQLIVKNAGKQLIQVIDNGCGMSDTDARLSFERHATSKISKVEDLSAIRTMGFRGEALASVASIAQVEMRTKRTEDDLGTRISIEGGKVILQEACQNPDGSNVTIKNLFYSVPARRNFLKTDSVELRHIIEEFQRIAISHPDLFFSMVNDNEEIFHLKPTNLRQRIVHIFGKNYNERLVPVEETTTVLNIRGFIGKPDKARKMRGEQFFFVNDRFIKSPYLNHAVFNAYQDLIPENHYPLYVLFIETDPSRIDVNVHPSKQEIKFEEEKIVYTFIKAAVKHSLAQYSLTPTLDFDQDPTFSNIEFHQGGSDRNEGNFERSTSNSFTMDGNWEKMPRESSAFISRDEEMVRADSDRNSDLSGQQVPIQIHYQFILTQIKSGFVLLEQQLVHERILYERFLQVMEDRKSMSQKKLFPKVVECTAADMALMRQIIPAISPLGFDIEEFGNDSLVIHGVPMEIADLANEEQMIDELLQQFRDNYDKLKLEVGENIARSLARTSSIKPGQKLEVIEMQRLIDELFACNKPFISPGGYPTIITFTLDELSNRFRKKS